jgi:hypothetical protein
MLALTLSLSSPAVCRDSSDLLLQIQDDLSVFVGIDAEQRAELARRGKTIWSPPSGHVLARFGLSPRHFADRSYRFHPGYAALLRFWLDDYLPTLRHEAAELAQMTDLPEPLRLLRDACVRRHARIEWNFRGIALPAAS